jgi:Flp pilus assembly protein TadD
LLGRSGEALTALHAAERLDPLSVLIGTQIGLSLYEARRYAEAADQLFRTVELDAAFPLAHTCLGMTYVQQSLYEEAAREFRLAAEIAPTDLTPKALLGYVRAVTGKRADAQKILRGLQSEAKKRHVSAAYSALVHLGLGDLSKALDLAELACTERSGFLTRLKVDPVLDGLRSEARFAKLLGAVGLG